MKQKYELVEKNFFGKKDIYFEDKDKTMWIPPGEEMQKQLIYDLKNGFEVEICGKTLTPVREINNDADILDVFFKEHGKNEDDPVYLTTYLYGLFTYNKTRADCFGSKIPVCEVWINRKKYYINSAKNDHADDVGLPVTEENIKAIKEIMEMVKK